MDLALIGDWLSREGGALLAWWLLTTLAGALVWPLLYRILGGLPDRGYTLARAAGLMLTAFVFWFLGSVGLLRNTPGGAAFAWLAVGAISVAAYLRWPGRAPLRPWLREHRALIITAEVLFAALFFGWSLFRAHYPEMYSTEKPMEIMFLNSIRASDAFPPHDAWLAGYAISYYYFGYLIAAMLADLAAANSGVAFNLMLATLIAQAGVGALGVVYNLARAAGRFGRQRPSGAGGAIAAGLLAACFLALMGNLGVALVELPYRGYASGAVGAGYFDFWNVPERDGMSAPPESAWEGDPQPLEQWDAPRNWWWFRYSRVINDIDLAGQPEGAQPIAEFPSFSFVLGDMHPHVLALPFAVLAVGLALNLALRGAPLRPLEYPLYAIWVGGMVFVNSWDAVYLALLVGAEALRRLLAGGGRLTTRDLWETLLFAAAIGALTLVLYLPWLISFTSQAGGVLPNVIYPTAWQQFFLQFGAFLIVLAVFLAVEARRAGRRFNRQAALVGAALVGLALLAVMVALGVVFYENVTIRGAIFRGADFALPLGDHLPDILRARLPGVPSELLLLAMIGAVVGLLFARANGHGADDSPTGEPPTLPLSQATAFTLLLIGAGAVLTLAPDFVYLRDNFGVRINTVFKLYYQGWLLFSLASAFAVWSLLAARPEVEPSPAALGGRVVFGAVVLVLFAAGMLYPALAFQTRALDDDLDRRAVKTQRDLCAETPGVACPALPDLTLDGRPTFAGFLGEGEFQTVQCFAALDRPADAVIAEAPFPGGYNPSFSRFSALTGVPTLMGWQGHEGQWRGPTYPEVTDARRENGQYRDRIVDVQEMYTTQDWDRAWAIIDRYGIDYIVVGGAERQMIARLAGDDLSKRRDYELGLAKFEQVLTPVCGAGGAVVYRVAPG